MSTKLYEKFVSQLELKGYAKRSINSYLTYKEQLNHECTLIDTNREGVTENPTLTLWVQKLNALILSLDAEFIGVSPLFVFISACLGVAQRRRVHSWFSYFRI